jgi:hypothetical protein
VFSPRCNVCTHTDSVSIDFALLDSIGDKAVSMRAIARQFGVSKDSVSRHWTNHLSPALKEAYEKVRKERGASYVEYLKSRRERLERKSDELDIDPDKATTFIGAEAEIRRYSYDMARATGEIKDSGPEINMNVALVQSPAWIELRTVLFEVLDGFPEARGAFVRALEERLSIEG